MQRRGKKSEKFFSDKLYGGNRRALSAAKYYRDQLEASSRTYSVKELSRRPSARNRSGVVGVRLHKQIDYRGEYQYHYWYWIASWIDGLGRRRSRSYSIHRHGEEKAFEMACAARRKGVNQAKR
jgi:hypothetical protein